MPGPSESGRETPRAPAARVLALCESIHAVLALERALLAAGVSCDLVPVPRALAADCGLCVTLRAEELEWARPVLLGPRTRVRGIYEAAPNGYRSIQL